MFIVACVPYPAQFCLPGAYEEHALLASLKVVCRGWGWAPSWLPCALGPCYGLRGAPRCPLVTALAVAQAVLLSGNAW
eukprot:3479625-Alexandrium_andersonii.AAC.1